MSYHLFLDDERTPEQVRWVDLPKNVEWVIVRNFVDFCNTVQNRGIPEFISYDHDLGDEIVRRDGYACAWIMIDACEDAKVKHPNFQVHSMNPVGAENIRRVIENYNRHVQANN